MRGFFSAPLTGAKVLAITIAAFGVIIAVNLTLAFQAAGTFPGLEVPNSYVASQSFDRDRSAQLSLGWRVVPEYDGEVMRLTLTDRTGRVPRVRDLSASIGRPTHLRDDQRPDFVFRDGIWQAPVTLAPGVWILHVTAHAPDGTLFRQRIDHYHGSTVTGPTGSGAPG